jgi:hypothetical protein
MAYDPTNETTRYEMRRERRHEHYGLLGPILLVTIGLMFLVGQFIPSWGVGRTWPVLLIVIGVSKLFGAVGSRRSLPRN